MAVAALAPPAKPALRQFINPDEALASGLEYPRLPHRFALQLSGTGAVVGLVILCFDLPGFVTGVILGCLLDRYQPRLVPEIRDAQPQPKPLECGMAQWSANSSGSRHEPMILQSALVLNQ